MAETDAETRHESPICCRQNVLRSVMAALASAEVSLSDVDSALDNAVMRLGLLAVIDPSYREDWGRRTLRIQRSLQRAGCDALGDLINDVSSEVEEGQEEEQAAYYEHGDPEVPS